MTTQVKSLTKDWDYDVVSMAYPGLVVRNHIATEPYNLGRGWVGFDFEKAFGRPVKIINDAAMQALGGYQGWRMLNTAGSGAYRVVTWNAGSVAVPPLQFTIQRPFDVFGRDRRPVLEDGILLQLEGR
jgi:hypothetical protein